MSKIKLGAVVGPAMSWQVLAKRTFKSMNKMLDKAEAEGTFLLFGVFEDNLLAQTYSVEELYDSINDMRVSEYPTHVIVLTDKLGPV